MINCFLFLVLNQVNPLLIFRVLTSPIYRKSGRNLNNLLIQIPFSLEFKTPLFKAKQRELNGNLIQIQIQKTVLSTPALILVQENLQSI